MQSGRAPGIRERRSKPTFRRTWADYVAGAHKTGRRLRTGRRPATELRLAAASPPRPCP